MSRAAALFPDPRVAEAFQGLRVRIDLLWKERPWQALLVASASHPWQAAPVAAFLGAALAWSGRRVVVVSADLHRPQIESLFGVPAAPGLSEAVAEEADLPAVLHRTWIPNLEVLPAGAAAGHPADVLASPWAVQVFKEARATADAVVVQGPPVLAGPETAILASHCDAALLVVEGQRTTAAEAIAAKAELEKVGRGGFVLGIVLGNGSELPPARRYRKRRPDARRSRHVTGASWERSGRAGLTEEPLLGQTPINLAEAFQSEGPRQGSDEEARRGGPGPLVQAPRSVEVPAAETGLRQLAKGDEASAPAGQVRDRRPENEEKPPGPRVQGGQGPPSAQTPEGQEPSREQSPTRFADTWVFK
jgi:Mrp family chromosome partitioning ATPase